MQRFVGNAARLRFALPDPCLRPYVTTVYRTDISCPPHTPWLEDRLLPEWANLRFLAGAKAQSVIGGGEPQPSLAFAVTGPTSRAIRFRMGSGHSWGIGLLPLGWARLFPAAAASAYADCSLDGSADPLFAAFVPLAEALAAGNGDYSRELALIGAHLAQVLAASPPLDPAQEGAILALNAALVDPDVVAVADLAERLGITVRSVERLSARAFGFPPKLLLRRQRFLRSLSRFMLDPSLKWHGTIDSHYHDQSHFVRDFRRFRGMSPSAYARAPKPLLMAAAKARAEIAGEAVQGLHPPAG
ncbi:MAG: AraC family transcriptional regulator [Porphyrobacter sp.]|nr:AraC family transcriptional regulator [Porphyrobacter sp.]